MRLIGNFILVPGTTTIQYDRNIKKHNFSRQEQIKKMLPSNFGVSRLFDLDPVFSSVLVLSQFDIIYFDESWVFQSKKINTIHITRNGIDYQ